MLDKAQYLVNEAFYLLDDEEAEKCDRFSGLTCDIDEAIDEVKNL